MEDKEEGNWQEFCSEGCRNGETFLCLEGGKGRPFFDIIKPGGGEGSVLYPEPLFTPTCRHGTFEVFVKRGIWQRATRVLSFTTSLWDDNARSRLHLPLGAQAAEFLHPSTDSGGIGRGEVIQAFLFKGLICKVAHKKLGAIDCVYLCPL